MVGMMRRLGWDDADSGALTIELVDRICDPRPGFIIGLMVGVMNPLGWAFAGPLILDPSVRWLALSPAREAPGRDSVRWLISRTRSDGATSMGNR
jgi:hypothetical protein